MTPKSIESPEAPEEPVERVTEEYASRRRSNTNLGFVVMTFGVLLVMLSVLKWDTADITVLLVGCAIVGYGGFLVDPSTIKGYISTIKDLIPGKK